MEEEQQQQQEVSWPTSWPAIKAFLAFWAGAGGAQLIYKPPLRGGYADAGTSRLDAISQRPSGH
eukprot:6685751-Pyramimonas_sp.AAC.1